MGFVVSMSLCIAVVCIKGGASMYTFKVSFSRDRNQTAVVSL